MRLLVGLLFITSCGRQVSIDHTALEEASKLQSETKSLQGGVINKMKSGNTYLLHNNFSYRISETSSYISKSFIEQLPVGQTDVNFKGKILLEEIALTEISRK